MERKEVKFHQTLTKTPKVCSSSSGLEEVSKPLAEKLRRQQSRKQGVLEPEAALMKVKHSQEHVATRHLDGC